MEWLILLVAGGRGFGVHGTKHSHPDPGVVDAQASALFRALNVIDEHGSIFDPGTPDGVPCIARVIQGGATGADELGKRWADYWRRPCDQYDADWKAHGQAAGPLRNQRMLNALLRWRGDGHVVAALVAPGGTGSADMVRQLEKAGVTVYRVDVSVGCSCHDAAPALESLR